MRLFHPRIKLSEFGAISAGLALGLLLLMAAAAASVLSLYAHRGASAWVDHTRQVTELLAGVLAQLQDTETGQRGYIITGDERYLEPYNEALRNIVPYLDRLTRLTADNPQQHERVTLLRSLASSRLAIVTEGIEQRRTGGFEAGARVVASGRGKATMDRIRAVIAELGREEAWLLAGRVAVASQRERWLVISTVVAGALGVLLVALATAYAWHSRGAALAAYGQLRESELRYRTLFDSIDEGFCIIEVIFDEDNKPMDYRFLEINPSFETQTGLANAQGRTMRELAPKHEKHWADTYGEIALTGRPARFQNRAEQLGRWYDVYAFRYGQPGSRQVAVLFNDITERQRTDEALHAANRELTDFATIVSHDLKSPLRAVSTLARWMQSDYADKLDEEGRENLAEMVRRVGRMDRMIDDILAYSRLGRTEGKCEPVPLDDLVCGVVKDLSLPAQVHICVAAGLPVVHGEPVRLRQLFQNLIANAIQHGDKPRIEVRVDWADRGVFWQFTVVDNGPGIEERHFERIFKIFQTLAPKDKTNSTGVGLALVKRIVEGARGRVWVESRVSQGSMFHFTWPKKPQASRKGDLTRTPGEAEPTSPQPSPDTQRRTKETHGQEQAHPAGGR